MNAPATTPIAAAARPGRLEKEKEALCPHLPSSQPFFTTKLPAMFMNKSLLAVAALLVAVRAQDSTTSAASSDPTAGLDTCIITCLTSAASSAGCNGITDLTCLCSSTAFTTAAATCLQSNCTAADLQTALTLQQSECASVSASSGASSTTESESSTSGVSESVTVSTSTTVTSSPSATSTHSSTSVTVKTSTSTTPANTSSGSGSATSSSAAAGKASFSFSSLPGLAAAAIGVVAGAFIIA